MGEQTEAVILQFPAERVREAKFQAEETLGRVVDLFEYLQPQGQEQAVHEAALPPVLRVVSEYRSQRSFRSADDIPALASARAVERQDAERLLTLAKEPLNTGDFEQIKPPVDALGTAAKYVRACEVYGPESYQARTMLAGLILDCERYYAEAESKRIPAEVFPEIEHNWDDQLQDFVAHGLAMTPLVDNGISAVVSLEHRERRKNEKIEEGGTYRTIGKLLMSQGVAIEPVEDNTHVITVSQISDEAMEGYLRNPSGDFGGEVPELAKMMIRFVRFDQASQKRFEKVIALTGTYITNDIINKTYQKLGITRHGTRLSKTEIQGTQVVTSGSFDSLDFIRLLDETASEVHSIEIFMGEPLGKRVKDYAAVERESFERQATQKERARNLSQQLITWEKAGVDHWVAGKMVMKYIGIDLHAIAQADPVKAAAYFDKKTALGYEEAMRLQQLGLTQEADALRNEVFKAAPKVAGCRPGDTECGLEHATLSKQELKDLGIENDTAYDYAKDTARACSCGKKEVVYAYNLLEVRAKCRGCGSMKINGKIVKAGKQSEPATKQLKVAA